MSPEPTTLAPPAPAAPSALPAPAAPATTTASAASTATAGREREGSDFAQLARRITEEGLLDRRPGYYTARIGLTLAAFAGGWYALFALGDTWLQLALAAGMSVVFTQLGLLAHDLAHRQVFGGRRASEIGGRIVANLLMGMSYGWWMSKHTRHHANPNHEGRDPDVSPDIVVWSQQQALESRGAARFIGRRLAYLFVPLLCLEGLNLSWNSFRALRRPGLKRPRLEGSLLVLHFAAYFGVVLAALPAGKAIAFLAVHQALLGILLGCVFAPNHKGMLMVTPEMRLDFLRRRGADLAQRPRQPGARHPDGWPQLPDRAPPLPQHADARTPPGRPDHPPVLRGEGHPVLRDRTAPLLPRDLHPPPPHRRAAAGGPLTPPDH